VVVIDPTREAMATSVINRPASAIAKFNATIKIHKYRGLHEKYHFIPMAMDVHSAPMCDMDHFIKKRACHPCVIWIISLRSVLVFFMIDNQKII
jgi:hypothetical protein